MTSKIIFLFFSSIFLLTACEVINPEEDIPSYLNIAEIDVNVSNPTTYGGDSHNITDAWVFIDDDLIGAFELPATIPILEKGKHNLKVKAGIKNNGEILNRIVYPFYTTYEIASSFDLHQDSIVKINPIVDYEKVNVVWLEDFETPGVSIDTTSNSESTIIRTTDSKEVKVGKGSGIINLSSSNKSFVGVTSDLFILPKEGTPVYLEMDYKTDVFLSVYLSTIFNSTESTSPLVVILKPKKENGKLVWNKIYLELTELVSSQVEAIAFQLVFTASIDNSDNDAQILLDNIKLIHS